MLCSWICIIFTKFDKTTLRVIFIMKTLIVQIKTNLAKSKENLKKRREKMISLILKLPVIMKKNKLLNWFKSKEIMRKWNFLLRLIKIRVKKKYMIKKILAIFFQSNVMVKKMMRTIMVIGKIWKLMTWKTIKYQLTMKYRRGFYQD